jgi:hypothetical protein
MQPFLRGDGQTAFFGDRYKVAKMAKFQGQRYLSGMPVTLQSLSHLRQHHLNILLAAGT